MNPLSLAKRYIAGVGNNQYAQEALDYGLGALTAGGLTALGNLGGGADQNVLLQGVLGAPLMANALRRGRSFAGQQYLNRTGASTPAKVYEGLTEAEADQKFLNRSKAAAVQAVNQAYAERQLQNPYMRAALAGSAAATIGGLSGRVFDNDATATSIGLAALGGVAPITYSMIRSRGNTMASEPIGTSRKPVNPKTGYYEDAVEGVPTQTTSQPRYSRNPSRIDLATGTYSRNPSRITL